MTAFSLPFASDASPSPLLEMLRMAGTLRRRLTSASGRSLCLCSPPGYLGHRGCGTQKSTGNFVGGSSALRKSMLTGRGGGKRSVKLGGGRLSHHRVLRSVRSVRSASGFVASDRGFVQVELLPPGDACATLDQARSSGLTSLLKPQA